MTAGFSVGGGIDQQTVKESGGLHLKARYSHEVCTGRGMGENSKVSQCTTARPPTAACGGGFTEVAKPGGHASFEAEKISGCFSQAHKVCSGVS